MRKILIVMFIVCIAGLTSCIRIDAGKNSCKKDNYKGVISKIYQDKIHHYTWTFQIKSDNSTFDRDAQLWPKSWEYAKVGDSILKQADTLMLIIKKNITTQKEFNYKF